MLDVSRCSRPDRSLRQAARAMRGMWAAGAEPSYPISAREQHCGKIDHPSRLASPVGQPHVTDCQETVDKSLAHCLLIVNVIEQTSQTQQSSSACSGRSTFDHLQSGTARVPLMRLAR